MFPAGQPEGCGCLRGSKERNEREILSDGECERMTHFRQTSPDRYQKTVCTRENRSNRSCPGTLISRLHFWDLRSFRKQDLFPYSSWIYLR